MYATDGDQWFSYDNPYTMSIKAQYVTDNSLGGVMVRLKKGTGMQPQHTHSGVCNCSSCLSV
jgi:GH18 family chitinase